MRYLTEKLKSHQTALNTRFVNFQNNSGNSGSIRFHLTCNIIHQRNKRHIHESHLEVSEFGKRVNDDTKDDVQANGSNEDEERHVVHYQRPEGTKRAVNWIFLDFLLKKKEQNKKQASYNFCFQAITRNSNSLLNFFDVMWRSMKNVIV